MQTKRMRVVVLLIAGFVFLPACRKPAATNQTANSNAASPTLEALFGGGAAVTGERFYFRGTIANNLKIGMTIVRDRDQLTGTYFYPRVGKNIDLKGTIDKDGSGSRRRTSLMPASARSKANGQGLTAPGRRTSRSPNNRLSSAQLCECCRKR